MVRLSNLENEQRGLDGVDERERRMNKRGPTVELGLARKWLHLIERIEPTSPKSSLDVVSCSKNAFNC